jgi:hypothetical protein
MHLCSVLFTPQRRQVTARIALLADDGVCMHRSRCTSCLSPHLDIVSVRLLTFIQRQMRTLRKDASCLIHSVVGGTSYDQTFHVSLVRLAGDVLERPDLAEVGHSDESVPSKHGA